MDETDDNNDDNDTTDYRPYSGKLSREKTCTNFAIFPPSAKVFSIKF